MASADTVVPVVNSRPVCFPALTHEAVMLGRPQWKCIGHCKHPALGAPSNTDSHKHPFSRVKMSMVMKKRAFLMTKGWNSATAAHLTLVLTMCLLLIFNMVCVFRTDPRTKGRGLKDEDPFAFSCAQDCFAVSSTVCTYFVLSITRSNPLPKVHTTKVKGTVGHGWPGASWNKLLRPLLDSIACRTAPLCIFFMGFCWSTPPLPLQFCTSGSASALQNHMVAV